MKETENSVGISQALKKGIEATVKERKPNPFGYTCSHITRPSRIPVDSKIANLKSEIRFAFISFKHDHASYGVDFTRLCGDCHEGIGTETCYQEFISELPKGRGQTLHQAPNGYPEEFMVKLPQRDCRRGLDVKACGRTVCNGNGISWQQYKEALEQALEEGDADIVIANELSIPVTQTGLPEEFFNEIKYLANKKPSLIITGSFHDPRTNYNTGYIFTPEAPDGGYIFHKQVSATKIKEYISVTPRRQSIVVPAFNLNIGVIVCLDLLDYSTVATLVSLHDAIDFILVPAYSREIQSLDKVARIASESMPGGVGIINYCRSNMPSNLMYVFGKPQKPLMEKPLVNGSGKLSIYEIKWEDFRSEKWKRQYIEDDFNWLFRFSTIDQA